MTSQTNAEEAKGNIGRFYEDGLPVIYKFVNELPETEVRDKLQWLTVVSWKYDGAENNGMPLSEENQRMIVLEEIIDDELESSNVSRHVYSRTGNNLKNLVYYIHDRDQFLEKFNRAFAKHARYPPEITFYEDREWEDFRSLLSDFSNAANK